MGCIWSSKSVSRCSVCNCKQSRDSRIINNKCRSCTLVELSRTSTRKQFADYTYYAEQTRPLSTTQHLENVTYLKRTPVPNLNRHNVRGELPQPKPVTTSNEPQFGKYYCKSCRRSWQSLRSWSTKYQMCKNCKKPVYPHKLRELLASDYTSTEDDPKEHNRELCEMCKQLGYACKNYGRKVSRR